MCEAKAVLAKARPFSHPQYPFGPILGTLFLPAAVPQSLCLSVVNVTPFVVNRAPATHTPPNAYDIRVFRATFGKAVVDCLAAKALSHKGILVE